MGTVCINKQEKDLEGKGKKREEKTIMYDENNENWWEKRPSVLFVDDEQNILKSLGRVFRYQNYEMHFAESGEQALEMLEKIDVDLVITDQRMPGIAGTELLKIVRERWPHIMRLVLSGYADVCALLSAINEGEVYRFITKPWDDEAFRKILARSIEEGKILKGFVKFVEKLRKAAPDHRVETFVEIEKGKLHARIEDHGKKIKREQMALLIPILLDNIHDQFRGVEAEKLSGLIAKHMGRINFTAEIGAGVQLSVDIPVDEEENV